MIKKSLLLTLGAGCLLSCLALSRAGNATSVKISAKPVNPPAPKFALLVGINRYLSKNVKTLNGCENDVDDLKSVLTGLFRFSDDPEHIVTLKSEQATRQRILDEFRTHLIGNAKKYKDQKPTIVFYFSGHGSQVKDGPDQDEGDGLDETLVPHDRGVNNVTDIVDDEVDQLFEELRQYTTNITFILDSCHSGSASKGDLQPRWAPPLDPTVAQVQTVRASKDEGNPILKRRIDSYVTISACLPDELSYEAPQTTASGEQRTYGVMTFYLIKALRQHPDMTYRELWSRLRQGVEDKYSQNPQIEGNLDRPIFEGADPNARNYLSITALKGRRNITLDGGKALGLKEGSFIAIYAKKATKLFGATDKLAVAELIKVRDFESEALLQQNSKPIAPGDKAIVLTPGFGSERLTVSLDTKANPEGPVIKEVQRLLENYPGAPDARDKRNPLVAVALPDTSWDAAVQHNTFEQYKGVLSRSLTVSKETTLPNDKDEVYYITTRDGDPLYNFFVKADAPDAAVQIVDALERRARQRNVGAINNIGSALHDRITSKLLKVELDDEGRETTQGELPATAQGIQSVKIGDRFRFLIENKSSQKLFFTLIAINPSGSISIISTPEDFGGEVSPNIPVKSLRIKTGAPAGKTIFKLMVTTKKVDFSFLGQPALTRDAMRKTVSELTDPFARLVGQAYFGGTREAGVDDQQSFDDWTTVDIELLVNEK